VDTSRHQHHAAVRSARTVTLKLRCAWLRTVPPAILGLSLWNVAELTEALHDPSSQAKTATLIRCLLTTIRLIPVEGRVVLELVGELAGLLALGVQNDKSRAGGAARLSSTVVVAGAGFEPAAFRL